MSDMATPDATFSKLLQLVRLTQNGMRNIDSSHGLSGSQFWALWHISARPGLRVSELAEAMQIHHSTASNMLDKLEHKRLLRRERQVADNRVVHLHLSDKGQELVRGVPGPLQGRLRNALQLIPPTALEGLFEGLTNLLDEMSAASK
jgi:DNA-binding MarR family transcriptional regulator